jgi:hypothetical protein
LTFAGSRVHQERPGLSARRSFKVNKTQYRTSASKMYRQCARYRCYFCTAAHLEMYCLCAWVSWLVGEYCRLLMRIRHSRTARTFKKFARVGKESQRCQKQRTGQCNTPLSLLTSSWVYRYEDGVEFRSLFNLWSLRQGQITRIASEPPPKTRPYTWR